MSKKNKIDFKNQNVSMIVTVSCPNEYDKDNIACLWCLYAKQCKRDCEEEKNDN